MLSLRLDLTLDVCLLGSLSLKLQLQAGCLTHQGGLFALEFITQRLLEPCVLLF